MSTCPCGSSLLRNSCLMSLPTFLFLFSLTFQTSCWPMFKWGALGRPGERRRAEALRPPRRNGQITVPTAPLPTPIKARLQEEPDRHRSADLKVRIQHPLFPITNYKATQDSSRCYAQFFSRNTRSVWKESSHC